MDSQTPSRELLLKRNQVFYYPVDSLFVLSRYSAKRLRKDVEHPAKRAHYLYLPVTRLALEHFLTPEERGSAGPDYFALRDRPSSLSLRKQAPLLKILWQRMRPGLRKVFGNKAFSDPVKTAWKLWALPDYYARHELKAGRAVFPQAFSMYSEYQAIQIFTGALEVESTEHDPVQWLDMLRSEALELPNEPGYYGCYLNDKYVTSRIYGSIYTLSGRLNRVVCRDLFRPFNFKLRKKDLLPSTLFRFLHDLPGMLPRFEKVEQPSVEPVRGLKRSRVNPDLTYLRIERKLLQGVPRDLQQTVRVFLQGLDKVNIWELILPEYRILVSRHVGDSVLTYPDGTLVKFNHMKEWEQEVCLCAFLRAYRQFYPAT